jgi:hypothetical protein
MQTNTRAAGPKLKLDKALQVARDLDSKPDEEESIAAAQSATSGLYFELSTDRQALASALSRLPHLGTRGELGMMAAVLGRIADPEVEQLALTMSQASSPLLREAAFDILDGLDLPSGRSVAVRALRIEGEVDVRRAAVRAMPEPRGASEEDADEVVKQLSQVLGTDQDPETRRLAAISLASWHRNLGEFMVVLQHMISDESAGVRAGCAFACEISGRRDPEVVKALVQSLERTGEDDVVRDNGYRALKAMGPLPARASEAFKLYEQQMDDDGAGEGN